MNYRRIYDEFIADRLTKQPIDGYFEKHHILPRSLGGSDDASNLIRLTAGDHLMAHMLLAKVHGGKMIFALNAMLRNAGHCGRDVTSRRWRLAYKLAREEFGEKISQMFEDGEFRAHHAERTGLGTKMALSRPEVKERHLAALERIRGDDKWHAALSAGQKIAQNKPELKAVRSRMSKEYWQNEEYREAQLEKRKAEWANPEQRANRLAGMTAYQSSPEGRARNAEAQKKRHADPVRSASHKAAMASPEVRKKLADATREVWRRKREAKAVLTVDQT